MARDWSTAEIEATVAEYFAMLRLELAGFPYTKSEHNERVRRLLDGRSKAAVEYKFQNISAVLVNHHHVYVKGYLPAQNYQRALEAAVLEWLGGDRDLPEIIERSSLVNPPMTLEKSSFREILTDPPEQRRAPQAGKVMLPVKIDFVRLDAENRRLGTKGEEFVYELEQRRLFDDERRPDLAKLVRWCSRDDGDGLGYDILSFEEDGGQRFIEVKTTGAGKYLPFALTRNELFCSQKNSERYRLYRLYEFGAAPRLYILAGALDQACALTPTQYRAVAKRREG